MVTVPEIPARFTAKLERWRSCWLWTGSKSTGGYGTYQERLPNGWHRTISPHRYLYEKFVGPIPEGYQIDHLCGVRHCCNPMHLEAVTPQENIRRVRIHKNGNTNKTHCKRGHSLADAYRWGRRQGRTCRTCSLQREARRRVARRNYKNPSRHSQGKVSIPSDLRRRS